MPRGRAPSRAAPVARAAPRAIAGSRANRRFRRVRQFAAAQPHRFRQSRSRPERGAVVARARGAEAVGRVARAQRSRRSHATRAARVRVRTAPRTQLCARARSAVQRAVRARRRSAVDRGSGSGCFFWVRTPSRRRALAPLSRAPDIDRARSRGDARRSHIDGRCRSRLSRPVALVVVVVVVVVGFRFAVRAAGRVALSRRRARRDWA